MKLILTTFLTLFIGTSFGQYMILDANVGTRMGGVPGSDSRGGGGYHLDGAVGFMITPTIGLKGVLAYDGMTGTYEDLESNTTKGITSHVFRSSLEAVLSVSELAHMEGPLGINFHGGLGISTMSNKNLKASNPESGLLKGNDHMGNVIFGLRALFGISDNISLTADASSILLVGNNRRVDGTPVDFKSTVNYQTLAVGINWKLK